MTEFAQFYQQGGVFMHLVTLLSLAAAAMLATRAVRLRILVERVRSAQRAPTRPDDGLLIGLVVVAMLLGALGTTAGVMEACAALRTIPPEHHVSAVFRAIPIALTPLAWSCLLSAALVLGHAVVRGVENRLRGLIPST